MTRNSMYPSFLCTVILASVFPAVHASGFSPGDSFDAGNASDVCEPQQPVITKEVEEHICSQLPLDFDKKVENDEMAQKDPFKICGQEFNFTIKGLPDLNLLFDFNVCDVIKDDLNSMQNKLSDIENNMQNTINNAYQSIEQETSAGLNSAGIQTTQSQSSGSSNLFSPSGSTAPSSNNSSHSDGGGFSVGSGNTIDTGNSQPSKPAKPASQSAFDTLYGG